MKKAFILHTSYFILHTPWFMVHLLVLLFVLSVSLLPGVTFANHPCSTNPWPDSVDGHPCVDGSGNQGGGQITSISGFLGRISSIIDTIIPFIIGLAVFVIIWGIFNYLVHASEEEKRAEARKYIVWGVIALFFMLSIWGFVNILLNTFSLKRTISASDIPHVPRIGGTRDADNPDDDDRDGGPETGIRE